MSRAERVQRDPAPVFCGGGNFSWKFQVLLSQSLAGQRRGIKLQALLFKMRRKVSSIDAIVAQFLFFDLNLASLASFVRTSNGRRRRRSDTQRCGI